MAKMADLIARAQERATTTAAEYTAENEAVLDLRSRLEAGDAAVTPAVVQAAIAKRADAKTAADAAIAAVEELRADDVQARLVAERAAQVNPTPVASQVRTAYDQVIRTGNTREERTYALHKERGFSQATGTLRRGAVAGIGFKDDVIAAALGDPDASARLMAHTSEERVERGQYLQRAVGTGAFAGLTVPQYLVDLWAPKAAAKRPFADIMNAHPLPAQGMTAYISQITTATSVADQASENAAVSETDIDDTLLTVPIRTASGQQTMSLQSIQRAAGTEEVVLDDLYRRYATNLDSNIINAASTGLTNVATAIAYTDATPTVAECLPKFSQAAAGIEAALLDNSSGELVIVMNGRRWFWLNQALSTSFPMLNQPGAIGNAVGANYGETYGRGYRGVLPNGLPVVVDNNIATNLGAGTNEDEIYVVDRNECHLWEDPSAPMFIRAEQTKAANLGVLLVVYGYYAFTHARLPHAQKINGTGLVTPTWTGV